MSDTEYLHFLSFGLHYKICARLETGKFFFSVILAENCNVNNFPTNLNLYDHVETYSFYVIQL